MFWALRPTVTLMRIALLFLSVIPLLVQDAAAVNLPTNDLSAAVPFDSAVVKPSIEPRSSLEGKLLLPVPSLSPEIAPALPLTLQTEKVGPTAELGVDAWFPGRGAIGVQVNVTW